MTKHAVALRAFTHAGDSYEPGSAFPIAAGHLADWSAEGVGLVREATAAEIAQAKGDKPASRPGLKRTRKAKSAPAPAPAPVASDPDPAAPAA